MSKFLLGIITGILVMSIIHITGVYAERKYSRNREVIADFSESSVPVLNQILQDIHSSIDGLDVRVKALE